MIVTGGLSINPSVLSRRSLDEALIVQPRKYSLAWSLDLLGRIRGGEAIRHRRNSGGVWAKVGEIIREDFGGVPGRRARAGYVYVRRSL